MDKLTHYRTTIRSILTEYARIPILGDMENELVFDEANDRYLLLVMGWEKSWRVYGVSIHMEIRNGKIYMQENNTDQDIAQELLDGGIAQEDIVLAFNHPELRKHTGFAVA